MTTTTTILANIQSLAALASISLRNEDHPAAGVRVTELVDVVVAAVTDAAAAPVEDGNDDDTAATLRSVASVGEAVNAGLRIASGWSKHCSIGNPEETAASLVSGANAGKICYIDAARFLFTSDVRARVQLLVAFIKLAESQPDRAAIIVQILNHYISAKRQNDYARDEIIRALGHGIGCYSPLWITIKAVKGEHDNQQMKKAVHLGAADELLTDDQRVTVEIIEIVSQNPRLQGMFFSQMERDIKHAHNKIAERLTQEGRRGALKIVFGDSDDIPAKAMRGTLAQIKNIETWNTYRKERAIIELSEAVERNKEVISSYWYPRACTCALLILEAWKYGRPIPTFKALAAKYSLDIPSSSSDIQNIKDVLAGYGAYVEKRTLHWT